MLPEPGRLFAERFELRRPLGRGASGEVFEAIAHLGGGLERRVALKRLRADAAGPKALDALREEARIASSLHHGGIAQIIDFGVWDGQAFLVLELVDGMSAADAVRRAREIGQEVPFGVALAIVVAAARALHHAHEARDANGRPLGIVHRDVKPSNILLSFAGDVKLVDFGIALADDRIRDTTTGFSKGTRGYMSPEQIIRGPLDARADVFSLGCTLHTLLLGDTPARSDAAIARLLAYQPLDVARGSLPEDVYQLVARAVAPRPAERHPSALAFAEEAARALAARGQVDGRGLVARWLASMRGVDPPAPAVPPPTMTIPPVLARVGATDTFERADTLPVAAADIPPAKTRPTPPAEARGRRTFGLALGATALLGVTFALGILTVVVLGPPGVKTRAAPATSAAEAVPAVVPVAANEAVVLADASNEAVAPPVDAAVAIAIAAPPPPRAAEVQTTRPRATAPAAATSAAVPRRGSDCFCMSDGSALCRRIIPPVCGCWRNRDLPSRTIMCLAPYDRKKGEECRDVTRSATQGAACVGYHEGSERITGTWQCETCDRHYDDGLVGSSCEGIVEASGVRKSGALQCLRERD